MFEAFLGVNPWTALFVLLNTLTIYFVAKKHLFLPVMKMIEDRQSEIDGIYAAADRAKADAEAMRAAYDTRLSDAGAEGERIVKEAVARARLREEEILRQASAEAEALLTRAAADSALEKQKALASAKDEISGLCVVIAGKVLERQLHEADQQQLIRRFIDDLEAGA